jgi:hypothetical protein
LKSKKKMSRKHKRLLLKLKKDANHELETSTELANKTRLQNDAADAALVQVEALIKSRFEKIEEEKEALNQIEVKKKVLEEQEKAVKNAEETAVQAKKDANHELETSTELANKTRLQNDAADAALVEIEALIKSRFEKIEEEKEAANKLKEVTAQINAKASQLKAAALALAQAQAQAQAHAVVAQAQVAVQAVQAAPPLEVLSIASITALHACSSLEEFKSWVNNHDKDAKAVMRFMDENNHHLTLEQQRDLLTSLVLTRGSVFKDVEARNYAKTIADLTNYLLANNCKKFRDVTTPFIGMRTVGMVYQILTIGQGFEGTANSHEQLIEKTGSGFAGEFGRLNKARKDFNGTLKAERNLLKTANSLGVLDESDVWGHTVVERAFHEALRASVLGFNEFPHKDHHRESYALSLPGTPTTLLSMLGRIVTTKIIIKHLEMLHASNGTALTKKYAIKDVQERAVFSYEQPWLDLVRYLEFHEERYGKTKSSVKLVADIIMDKKCACCGTSHNTPTWTFMDENGIKTSSMIMNQAHFKELVATTETRVFCQDDVCQERFKILQLIFQLKKKESSGVPYLPDHRD